MTIHTRDAASSMWVRGPAWDGVWMLSALWLAPLVVLLSLGSDDPEAGSLDVFYFAVTALLWLGHRMGSTWLAYFTTAYRPLVRAEPIRFLLVPALIATGCFVLLLPPDDALPWSRTERVTILAILDYVLVTHHFASQHFGALSLYRMRTTRRDDARRLRRLDRLYAFAVGGLLVFVAEIVAGTVFFIDVWIDPWLDPDRVASAADSVAAVATTIVTLGTLGMLALEARADHPSLPRTLYLVGLGTMVIAAFHVRVPFVFVVLWTVQHWLVANGVATLVAAAEPAPPPSRARRALHAVNRRPWALLLVLATLSILFLPILQVEAANDGGPFYADRIFGELATALRTSDWLPALLALGFTTGFWHYWLDRAVYRFSDARIREAARGLLPSTTAGAQPTAANTPQPRATSPSSSPVTTASPSAPAPA